MTIKRSNRLTSYQIGIRRALCESDKPCDGPLLIFRSTSQVNPNLSISLEFDSPASLRSICAILLVCCQFCVWQQLVDESVSNTWLILVLKTRVVFSKSNCCVKVGIQGHFTVRSLHAGTLVTDWTTAPSIPLLRSFKAQSASSLLLFCTLVIATRCYASTSSTRPQIDQAQSTPTFSPIRNSKIHSSNLVLSRLIFPHFVQKRYTRTSPDSRAKREVGKTNSNLIPEDPFVRTKERIAPFEEVKVQNLVGGNDFRNSGSFNREGAEVPSDVQIGENLSDVVSVTGNFSRVISQKSNYSIPEVERPGKQSFQEQNRRSMPPADGHGTNSSLDKWGVVVSIIVSGVALTVTFGLITCISSHYRAEAAADDGGTASDPNNAALTPTSAPMSSVVSAGATAGVGGMERLRGGAARDLAAAREQQVRSHASRTDLAVNLPPSIAMPDGEDHPYSNARIHIRDAEQEAEIYQKCIRPPPNRTVSESESPPPYRSSSAGLLGSSSSSSSSADWTLGGMSTAPLVERCHSMSSTSRRSEAASNQKTDLLQRTVKIFTGKRTTPQAPSPAPTLPVVVVPSRRRPPEQNPPPTNHRPSKGGV